VGTDIQIGSTKGASQFKLTIGRHVAQQLIAADPLERAAEFHVRLIAMLADNSERQKISVFRLGKVLFAAYAAAIGGSILTILLCTMVLGFEVVDAYIEKYSLHTLILFTAIAFPFVWKRLK
jgi:hypothetical protein